MKLSVAFKVEDLKTEEKERLMSFIREFCDEYPNLSFTTLGDTQENVKAEIMTMLTVAGVTINLMGVILQVINTDFTVIQRLRMNVKYSESEATPEALRQLGDVIDRESSSGLDLSVGPDVKE